MATDTDPCPACEGTGLVAPGPFADDPVSWPAYLELAARRLREGYPWESCAVTAGRLTPRPCPRCGPARDARGAG